MPALITPDLVALDADLGADKSAVVRRLAELVAAAGRATGADGPARRRHGPRGAGAHRPARAASPSRTAARRRSPRPRSASPGCDPKVDFGAPDGPADLVFLIAAPAEGDADHLTLLTALARALVRPEFVASLRAATSAEEIVTLVQDVVAPADGRRRRPPAGHRPPAPRPPRRAEEHRRGQRLPDRHRAHLHGGRQAHRRRRRPRASTSTSRRRAPPAPPRSTRPSSGPPTR